MLFLVMKFDPCLTSSLFWYLNTSRFRGCANWAVIILPRFDSSILDPIFCEQFFLDELSFTHFLPWPILFLDLFSSTLGLNTRWLAFRDELPEQLCHWEGVQLQWCQSEVRRKEEDDANHRRYDTAASLNSDYPSCRNSGVRLPHLTYVDNELPIPEDALGFESRRHSWNVNMIANCNLSTLIDFDTRTTKIIGLRNTTPNKLTKALYNRTDTW